MMIASFREGVSQAEWIATQKPLLQTLGMKYVRVKVVNEDIVDEESHVIVQFHVITVMGAHRQDELYELIRSPNGGWIINRIEVYTETFNTVP